MKKGLFLLVLGLMSWTVAGSALAGPFGRFARPPHQQQHPLPSGNDGREFDNGDKEHGEKEQQRDHADKPTPGQQAPAPGGHDNAELHPAPGPAGQLAAPQGPPFGGHGGARMSVEERQKLRRQINDAGRSLYTPNTGNK